MKTSILLSWDKGGRISHRFSGDVLPTPRNDRLLWVLAPSIPLFLAHQCGSMRPSQGLILSSTILEMLFDEKYLLTPINHALKGARIDFIFPGGPSAKVQFHPQHRLLANSDSVEEGVRQLINNYTHYVYSALDDYSKIVVKTMTLATTVMYFEFIMEQIQAKNIGKHKDKWMLALSLMAGELVATISAKYYVPEGRKNPENEEWARKQTDHLCTKLDELKEMRNSLFVKMGLY